MVGADWVFSGNRMISQSLQLKGPSVSEEDWGRYHQGMPLGWADSCKVNWSRLGNFAKVTTDPKTLEFPTNSHSPTQQTISASTEIETYFLSEEPDMWEYISLSVQKWGQNQRTMCVLK